MNIKMPARPEPIDINTSTTAVIVVDMQNDFINEGGLFDLIGYDRTLVQNVIEPTRKVLEAARQAGIPIIYLKMGFREDLSDLGSEGSPNRVRHLRAHVGDTIQAPDGSRSRVLIRDTWGTDIIPELKPAAGDIVIYKSRYSGFYHTDLDATLQKLGRKYLVFTGCTTSVCVESTVRDAMFRDYSAIVLEDCVAEPMGNGFARTNHEASLMVFQLVGWVSGSADFITAVKEGKK